MALINTADAVYLGDQPADRIYKGADRVWPAWTPAELFANGEQGAWYDPSDLTTMFQDAGGTIPVTGVEQPVGLILDKSGNGNHASQVTTTARPYLRADEAGRFYLELDGADDSLSAIIPSGLPANVYLAEALDRRGHSSTTIATSLSANSGANDYVDIFLQTSSRIQARTRALSLGINLNTALTASDTVPLNSPSMLEAVFNPIPGNIVAGVNGVDYPIGSPPGQPSNIPAGTVLGTQTTFRMVSSFPSRRYGAVALWRAPSASERGDVRRSIAPWSEA